MYARVHSSFTYNAYFYINSSCIRGYSGIPGTIDRGDRVVNSGIPGTIDKGDRVVNCSILGTIDSLVEVNESNLKIESK